MQLTRFTSLFLIVLLSGCVQQEIAASMAAPEPPAAMMMAIPDEEDDLLSIVAAADELPPAVMVQQQALYEQAEELDDFADEVAEIRWHLIEKKLTELSAEAERRNWGDTPPEEGSPEWERFLEWGYILDNEEDLQEIDVEEREAEAKPKPDYLLAPLSKGGAGGIRIDSGVFDTKPEDEGPAMLMAAPRPKKARPKRKRTKKDWKPGWKQ